jgi:hypothetical protein
MEYVNRQTGVKIRLDGLTEQEEKFYQVALKLFHQNIDWGSFDDFAFGMKSPVYSRHRSHQDVLENPVYLALKDMSIQLGVQQGKIVRTKTKQKRRVA